MLLHIITSQLHILFDEVFFMKYLKRYAIIGIFFVLITGTLAHFLYDWSGNNYIVGLFTPINESIWEHMKLLFFGIIIGTLLIPIFFYAYTSILGKDTFILDIGTFILSIIIAFWLSYKLTLSCKLETYTLLLCGLICILFISFMIFTYNPPETRIFKDPTVCLIMRIF